jgi:hypothetical protein
MAKTRKKRGVKQNKTYSKRHFNSGDGMLTKIWGPALWHALHTISFNYPVNPTSEDKKYYKNYILNLQYVLPCKFCRVNLKNNFKRLPLKKSHMKSRNSFSRYVYNLHEMVNKMLNKKSNLTYCEIRDRYEDFRSRCTQEKVKLFKFTRKERGCTEPLYGKKAKCVLKIIPDEQRCKTLKIDRKCIKHK